MQTIDTNDLKTALLTMKAVAEAIRELGQVPSGKLYAVLSGKMDLAVYTKVIETLKRTGLVREENYLLIWQEPKGGAR